MKIPSNKFTYNLVFFLILCFIILSYLVFFRYREGAFSNFGKSIKIPQQSNSNSSSSSNSGTISSGSSTARLPTYTIKTFSKTPTIVPPTCNLMAIDQCAQNSGFCIWDSITTGCLNKLDCTNLNQTICSKQNYCTWNSSINKCSVKT